MVFRFPIPGKKGELITVIPGFFFLERSSNKGMKWGLGGEWVYANVFFLLLSIGVLAIIVWIWLRDVSGSCCRGALLLMAAGILGNVTDRLIWGHVIDFLTFDFGRLGVTSFNVADCCLTLGAAWIVFETFRKTNGS